MNSTGNLPFDMVTEFGNWLDFVTVMYEFDVSVEMAPVEAMDPVRASAWALKSFRLRWSPHFGSQSKYEPDQGFQQLFAGSFEDNSWSSPPCESHIHGMHETDAMAFCFLRDIEQKELWVGRRGVADDSDHRYLTSARIKR